MGPADDRSPHVVCLLPVRNAAAQLPDWFASVAPFVDAVVALDDGSTDDTAAVLEANPMVVRRLHNPRRESYEAWNDSANRNRLLEAAADLEPDWIISVDADERLAAGDATALCRFIAEQAVPGVAYGFPVHRMVDDVHHHDGIETRSYRLFAFRPGQRFSADQLHFEAVPTAIPRTRWLTTDIRLQHLGSMTAALRDARRQKYLEADPGSLWKAGDVPAYTVPGRVRPWRDRPIGQPVVLSARYQDHGVGEPDLDWPVLSIVLLVDTAGGDEMSTFWADVTDMVDDRAEIIVIASNADIADDMARLCPGATVIRNAFESTAVARNLGLRVARGDYVVSFDAPADLSPGCWDALITTHDSGCAVVDFANVNDTASAAGWAGWLFAGGPCSFTREILVGAGGYDETIGNWADHEARARLVDAGHRVGHTSLLTGHHRADLATPGDFLERSREFGRVRTRSGQSAARVTAEVADRLRTRTADHGPARLRPLVLAGVAANAAGAASGAVTSLTERPPVPGLRRRTG